MKDYTNSSPSFSDSVKILETTDTNHADNFNESTKQLHDNTVANREKMNSDAATYSVITNGAYDGVDLTVAFADEIKNFSDVWAWLKDRITNANYEGLHISDYVPITMNGIPVKAQIAGIDVYYEAYGKVGHHIDFISKDLYPYTEGSAPYWAGSNNNGTSENSSPYMLSNIKTWLNNTLYGYLPTALKNVISEKYNYLESRYSSSGTLTDSTGQAWRDMGKLWLPTEYEVYGSCVYGTPIYSEGFNVQYPIFMDGLRHRIKHNGEGGSRGAWWLASVRSGNSAYACNVNSIGNAYYAPVNYPHFGVPVCFRISA